jgi:chemotaxis protein MotB
MTDEQPIIIIKKKGGHGGHHGGAWKVAYADFVTAMMSLFIVLWLMNSTPKPVQEAIAGYFNDPKGTASKKGSEGKPQPKEESKNKDDMAALKLDLTKAIEKMNILNKVKKQIEMSVTPEGLRIELVEDEKGTFFESGSALPKPMLADILKVLASQLSGLPNKLSIEGYTDAQPYANGKSYGNWELSADRANTARRVMQENGIHEDQVSQVRGFADQRLHVPDKPFDAANRRVSLLVQNLPKPGEGAGDKVKVADKAGEKVAEKGAESKSASASAEASTLPAKPSGAEPQAQPAAQSKTEGGLLAKAKGLFSHK